MIETAPPHRAGASEPPAVRLDDFLPPDVCEACRVPGYVVKSKSYPGYRWRRYECPQGHRWTRYESFINPRRITLRRGANG